MLTGLLTTRVDGRRHPLYDADDVPVGEDQKQHLGWRATSLSVQCPLQMPTSSLYHKPIIPKVGARIMGLDDPAVKMSKKPGRQARATPSACWMTDEIMYAFKQAVTDSGREIRFSDDPEKAGLTTC